MRLVTFTVGGLSGVGVVVENEVVDLATHDQALPQNMLSLLAAGEPALARARRILPHAPRAALSAVRLLAPVPRPPKILGIGLNYAAHARETTASVPDVPVVFNNQSTAVIGPNEPILLPPESGFVDYEGELAIVIGSRCRRVPAARAREVIAGYTLCNDVSVRDWQKRTPTMTMGKSWDTHCPLGPWLVTSDEIENPHALRLVTRVNGEVRQDASTSEMIFDCYRLVEHLSTAFTLEPGDVISTGTPSGVGMAMKPPAWLQAGDEVSIRVDGIGELVNPVQRERITS